MRDIKICEFVHTLTIYMEYVSSSIDGNDSWDKIVKIVAEARALQSDDSDGTAVLKEMCEAMTMQHQRHLEQAHITMEVASAIWYKARLSGEKYLVRFAVEARAAREAANTQIPKDSGGEACLKQRGEALCRGLKSMGVDIKHAQVLNIVAISEGFKNFQALKASLPENAPCFCPHCGGAATLKADAMVDIEQGTWNGTDYHYAGQGQKYLCTRCSGSFIHG